MKDTAFQVESLGSAFCHSTDMRCAALFQTNLLGALSLLVHARRISEQALLAMKNNALKMESLGSAFCHPTDMRCTALFATNLLGAFSLLVHAPRMP